MSSSPLMLSSAPSSPKEGFALEDATGLSLNGDVDVHSIFVVSLPTSHPSFASQKLLEKSSRLKAPPLPDGPVELFIGILSAGNHFAERMAVWKSWMQHRLIKSPNVVARFFVALHPRREVNMELMKEAEFFGDIVLVPYMNTYDLVVLKTVAISNYGVHTVSANFIKEVKKVAENKSFYVGTLITTISPYVMVNGQSHMRNGRKKITHLMQMDAREVLRARNEVHANVICKSTKAKNPSMNRKALAIAVIYHVYLIAIQVDAILQHL
ncbi:hypothetical protein Vadar_022347 [Vaccinium darrowii]|uniref:Uncharacterized protein n=1 Tax=Vaccinium darrowii TaxID=229202 RepID=A0ACB7Y899_9ERIC|nr:hypothetical protein Vadar_022347 [Vaccinium darrowii]